MFIASQTFSPSQSHEVSTQKCRSLQANSPSLHVLFTASTTNLTIDHYCLDNRRCIILPVSTIYFIASIKTIWNRRNVVIVISSCYCYSQSFNDCHMIAINCQFLTYYDIAKLITPLVDCQTTICHLATNHCSMFCVYINGKQSENTILNGSWILK